MPEGERVGRKGCDQRCTHHRGPDHRRATLTAVDRHWRYVIALVLIIGYLGLAGFAFFHAVPTGNVRFVGGYLTGLGSIVGAAVTAVLGTGRGASPQQDANLATALDKLPPATIGTGPAQPLNLAGAEVPRR